MLKLLFLLGLFVTTLAHAQLAPASSQVSALPAQVSDPKGVLSLTDALFSGRELAQTYQKDSWVRARVTRCFAKDECETFSRIARVLESSAELVQIEVRTSLPGGDLVQTQNIERAQYEQNRSNPLRRVIHDTLSNSDPERSIALTEAVQDRLGVRINYTLKLKQTQIGLYIVLNDSTPGIAQIMAAGIQGSKSGVEVLEFGDKSISSEE